MKNYGMRVLINELILHVHNELFRREKTRVEIYKQIVSYLCCTLSKLYTQELCNINSFLTCRSVDIVYMRVWISVNHTNIVYIMFTITHAGMVVFVNMDLALFKTLLTICDLIHILSDYLKPASSFKTIGMF